MTILMTEKHLNQRICNDMKYIKSKSKWNWMKGIKMKWNEWMNRINYYYYYKHKLKWNWIKRITK